MKFEKKDFREVVEMLADRAGIEIPKDRVVDAAKESRRAELLKAHRLACDYYQRILWKDASAGQVRAYLTSRGLTEETIKEFQLGFATDAWEALVSALKDDVTEKTLEASGLILPGKEGKYYDRFRKRILFPILDGKGACVAFGARVLDDSQPKYLNSPETEIYSKGRQLYGLYQARTAIRTENFVIVVEGYMDVIGCHQAGVRNTVASLGTALTSEQARLMKRHTPNVTILYDADAAGEMATLRGFEILLEEGMEVRIVRLADGHDPDSYILKFGIGAFREALKNAKSLFEYKLDLLKKKYVVRTMEGRVKIANEMVTLFSKVKNEILRAAWTQELAKEMGLSEEAVRTEVLKAKSLERPLGAPAQSPARLTLAEIRPAEKILLGLMLERRAFLFRAKEVLAKDDFQHPALKRIVERMFSSSDQETSILGWMNVLQDDVESTQILALAAAEAERVPLKEKAFEDCLLWIERSRNEARRERLRSQLVDAQREGDQNRIHQLLHDFSELNKGMKRTYEKS
jgi:DNA primase